MKTKKCTVEPTPEPPPPDPCKLQRIRQKEKAGIIICPPVPIEPPPPPPSCLALCIEKIQNPDFTLRSSNDPVVCVVEREMTGTSRCDDIEDLRAAHPDLPWPGCPSPPPLPPPPEPDLCDIQRKREKLLECKERMKRLKIDMDQPSNEDLLANSKLVVVAKSYQDIDRQINDLESIITRLQEELTGMLNANDTNKQIEVHKDHIKYDKKQMEYDDKEQIEEDIESNEGDKEHIDREEEQIKDDTEKIKGNKEQIEDKKEQKEVDKEQIEGDNKFNSEPTTDSRVVESTASDMVITDLINKKSKDNLVYPVAIKDIGFDLSDLIIGSSPNIPLATKTSDYSDEYKSIREQFSVLWNEVRADTENKPLSISEYAMHNILAQIKEEVSMVLDEKEQRLDNSAEDI